jgi:hypothetical protein
MGVPSEDIDRMVTNTAERLHYPSNPRLQYSNRVFAQENFADNAWARVGDAMKYPFGFGRWGAVTRRRTAQAEERRMQFASAKRGWEAMADPAERRAAQMSYYRGQVSERVGPLFNAIEGPANALYGIAQLPIKAGGALMRGVGGVQGLGVGAGSLAVGAAGAALSIVRGTESVARGLLTGGMRGTGKTAVDAWLPGFRRFGWDDPRKIALNPRVTRRLVGASAVAAVGAGFMEALNPRTAPASFYLEAGGQIRHRNDMGAGAGYGQSMLGPNSLLSQWSNADLSTKLRMADMVI